ncbi:transcription factor bHLH53-like [Telopea speciosissima]|uniref:transcription factor bHLH53-like n=1 Tax=Telopea speciosissima TaxID=54955 RepID=UPI001CC75511|nr:transcription factor bHLH53-like [Telopea speciosissima]
MALSFCSNWATLQQLTPEMSSFQQRQGELARQVLGMYDNIVAAPPNTLVDPLFDPDDFLYTDNYASLPYFSPSPSPFVSLSPEFYPSYDFDYCDYSKRQKSFEDLYYTDFTPNCFDGYGLNSYPVPDFLPEIAFPTTEIPNPPVYSNGSVDNMKPNGVGSSAQSVAARQRRRKITEKTQELAKLIPGGNKLNTAEMFQAAFKYVKFLQAQVGILQFMGSIQEGKDESNVEGLGVLASPRIQEKLYLEEKCLVSKGLIETLTKDQGIKSNPMIAKGLTKLIQSEYP